MDYIHSYNHPHQCHRLQVDKSAWVELIDCPVRQSSTISFQAKFPEEATYTAIIFQQKDKKTITHQVDLQRIEDILYWTIPSDTLEVEKYLYYYEILEKLPNTSEDRRILRGTIKTIR
jgi:KaiC/GvpD/RAD55 family RecA-like ATPase